MTARTLIIAAVTAIALAPLAPGQAAGAAKSAKAKDAAPAAEKQTAPLLRDAVTVDDKMIYLGDLFLNVGEKAHVAVAYAPRPGERAFFDARWLYRVARAYRLGWRPLSARQQVIVERVSQVIERSEIEDTILAALFEKGADPASELDMTTQINRIHVAGSRPATVGVDDITYDPRTKRFAAVVSAPADDPAGQKLRFAGRLHSMIKIPVPARTVDRGDIIRKGDLKWIRIRADRVMPDTMSNIKDLVGMASKRGLRKDEVIRQSDVERPILVKRGSLITVSLNHGPMSLTAQGKALERGAKGDVVQIINSRSNTVFEGEVTGPSRARVKISTAADELAQKR